MIKQKIAWIFKGLLIFCMMLKIYVGFSQPYYEPISYPDTLEIISMYPFNYDTILIGTTCDNSYYWGCAYITYDGGETWEYAGLQNHFVYCFLRGNGDTIYAGASMGVYRTVNYGASWDHITPITDNVVCLSRLNSGVLFAGTWGGIIRSLDNGITWDTTLALDNASVINSVLIVSENEVYAGGTSYLIPGGGVFMTNDLGESWENIGLVSYNVQCLAKNQNDELFAGCYYSGLLKKSNDRGTWEEVLPYKDVLSIIINSDGMYIGCDQQNFPSSGGIFFSKDNGITWEDRTYNISNNRIADISITEDQFFYSLSRWESIVLGPILNRSIDQVSINEHNVINASDIKLFPNPASDQLNINYNVTKTGMINLSLYSLTGEQLLAPDLGTQSPANYSQTISLSTYPKGIYVITLSVNGVVVEQVKVVRVE